MNNNSKYTFKLIGFRCVTPKDTDTLICINSKGMKEVSVSDDIYNDVLAEVTFNQRKLNKDEKWYFFYDGYSMDNDILSINLPKVESSLLYSNNITTNVCCIVGKNGCGKSSIIEMILKIFNNFEFATKSHYYRINPKQTFMKYAENMFCDLLIEYNSSHFILSVRSRKLTIKQWMKTKWMNLEQCIVKNRVSIEKGDCVYEPYTTDFYGFHNFFNLFSLNHIENNIPSYKNKENNRIRLITELSNNRCIAQLSTIQDLDCGISIKMSTAHRQGNPLLNLCFYHDVQMLYPLRYINEDCEIEGFELKSKDIQWPTVSILYNYKIPTEIKEKVINYLKEYYCVSGDIQNEYISLVDNVLILAINILMTHYLDFAKKYYTSDIVKNWTKTKEYSNFETKHYKQMIKEGNYDGVLNNDDYENFITYKNEHENWLNYDLTNYLIQKISDTFIINFNPNNFKEYVIYRLKHDKSKMLESDIMIDKYMKIWKLLSKGVDVFFRNYEVNETIKFKNILKVKQEDTYMFNRTHINLKELKMSVFDLVYPLHLLSIDLVLRQTNDNTTRYFSGLSSGEQQLLYTRSNFIYHLIKIDSFSKYKYINAIFDEVEMFMHPEWQREFLSRVIEGINKINFKNLLCINILIATHSPFILSDVPKSNILFIEENGDTADKQKISNTFGANIHDMFNNSFFMDSTLGEIAIRHIKEIVSAYDKAKSDNENRLKSEIEQNKAKYDYILSIIGDKYYKYTIKSILDYIYKKYNIQSEDELNKEIAELQNALERLQNRKDRLSL